MGKRLDKNTDSPKLPPDIEEFINSLSIPDEKKDELKKSLILKISSTSFSGPLPPPSLLEEYDKVIDGGAERIVAMAEKQTAHRMKLEEKIVAGKLKEGKLGQIFGLISGLSAIIATIIFAIYGLETAVSIFGTTTIIGLVTIFIVGKNIEKNDD